MRAIPITLEIASSLCSKFESRFAYCVTFPVIAEPVPAICRGTLPLRMAGTSPATDDADLTRVRTPEIYFGSGHPTPQDRAQSPQQGDAAYVFAQPGGPRLNEYQLDGSWARGEEGLVLRSPHGKVRVRFSAAKLHLVAGASQPAPLRISVDGGGERTIEVSMPTLYTLLDGDGYGEYLLECATAGFSVFSATFG
jgi:hypothetical protein